MRKLILLIPFLISTLYAKPINLEDSIEMALQKNKEMQAEEYNLKSASWSKYNAFANFLPRVTFNSTIVRIDNETYDQATEMYQLQVLGPTGIPTGDFIPFSASAMGSGIYQTSYTNKLTIQQPIFNGGKVILGYQLAALSKNQAQLALENKELDIAYTIASTYLNYLKLEEIQKLTGKSLASSSSHLKKAKAKFETGTVTKSDVLQWQLKLNNDKTSNFEVENNLNEIKSYWKNLLGSVEDELSPAKIEIESYNDEIEVYAGMTEEQITQEKQMFLQKVKTTSPALNSIDLVNKMMKKKLGLEQGSFLPSVNLQFDYQLESDDKLNFSGEDNWNLVAAVSVPLFSSGSRYSKVKQAKYDLMKTRKQSEYTRENYLIAAANVFTRMITKAKLIMDNKTALELAKENQKVINNLYEQGMVTNSELLDAETMKFSSELNLISSYYDYILTKYEIKKYMSSMEE